MSSLGLIGMGDAKLPARQVVLDALYGTQREKSPDLHFSVGLALARNGMHPSDEDGGYVARIYIYIYHASRYMCTHTHIFTHIHLCLSIVPCVVFVVSFA